MAAQQLLDLSADLSSLAARDGPVRPSAKRRANVQIWLYGEANSQLGNAAVTTSCLERIASEATTSVSSKLICDFRLPLVCVSAPFAVGSARDIARAGTELAIADELFKHAEPALRTCRLRLWSYDQSWAWKFTLAG
ncbi:MAG: hypothetical protein QMD99_04770 [Rhizobiaceae bacterium]|nr:hypothetical protein [Rhizobiaceae bacterium]